MINRVAKSTRLPVPVARLLPREIREALVAASQIAAPIERTRTIDKVSDRARLTHPQFFIQE